MIQVACTFTASIWRITLKSHFPNCSGVHKNLAFLYVLKLARLWTSEDGRHTKDKWHAEADHLTSVKLAHTVLPRPEQTHISRRRASRAPERGLLGARSPVACFTYGRCPPQGDTVPSNGLERNGGSSSWFREVRNRQVYVLRHILHNYQFFLIYWFSNQHFQSQRSQVKAAYGLRAGIEYTHHSMQELVEAF